MNLFPYTYAVIRYVHDVVAGESLNVGVVLYSQSGRFLDARTESRYGRLAQAFNLFDSDTFRTTLNRFEVSLARLSENLLTGSSKLFGESLPENVNDAVRRVWPDLGLSYQLGPVLAGVSSDLDEELQDLFDRLVASQYQYLVNERRNDEDVYKSFRRSLRMQPELVSKRVVPHTFKLEKLDYSFKYAVKNEKWHPIQPVSLDLTSRSAITDKAIRVIGKAATLDGVEDVGSVVLLFGKPTHEGKLMNAYEDAKDLIISRLNHLHLDFKDYEEDQAPQFAEYVTTLVEHAEGRPLIRSE